MSDMPPESFRASYRQFWLHNQGAEDRLRAALVAVEKQLAALKWIQCCYTTVRPKSCESLWKKHCQNQPSAAAHSKANEAFKMEDLLGGRLVVLNLIDIPPAVDVVKILLGRHGFSTRSKDEEDWKKDHLTKPTKGGHRAFHLYLNVTVEDLVPCEVQILTECADFWTRWEHFLNYKPKQEVYKSGFEHRFFTHASKRLQQFDDESNDVRLELSYWRPGAAPMPEDDIPPTPTPLNNAPSWATCFTNRLQWLAVFNPSINSSGVSVAYDARTFGFGSEQFRIDGGLNEACFDENAKNMGLSKRVSSIAFKVLRGIQGKHVNNQKVVLFNGPVVRLRSYVAKPDHLSLWLEKTTYFTFLLTNCALKGETVGVDCAELRNELRSYPIGIAPASVFANNLAVHVTLLTADNKILAVLRSKSDKRATAVAPGIWTDSAGGDLEPEPWTPGRRGDLVPGTPNRPAYVSPFLAAARELSEELGVEVPLLEITAHALSLDVAEAQPILLFQAKTDMTSEEILEVTGVARDSYEASRVVPIPLDDGKGLQRVLQGYKTLPGYTDSPNEWSAKGAAGLLHAIDAWQAHKT